MKTFSFANQKFALRALFPILAFCLFLGSNAFSQRSKRVSIGSGANASSNLFGNFGADESEIFALVNDERRKKRLGSLAWDDDLAKVARKYSQQMAMGNFFGHFDKNGDGVEARVDAARIGWRKIGENLFLCQGIDDFDSFAVRGWMKSPSHRENILDSEWTLTGIGIAESRDGKIYVTQIFMK